MKYIWRCIIIPEADADLARQIWATLDAQYADEFKIPLADADDPSVITHRMTAGWVPEPSTQLMPFSVWQLQGEPPEWVETEADPGDPITVAEGCRMKGLEVTDEQVEDIWIAADCTDEPWETALGRTGLVRYTPPDPDPEELADAA